MKTTADAAMFQPKKTKPSNKCKQFKNVNGKKGNNSATMHKPKPNHKTAVKRMSIICRISCNLQTLRNSMNQPAVTSYKPCAHN